MAATDFCCVEVLIPGGLVRCMILLIINIASRRVEIAGIKTDPNGDWMRQIARNVTEYQKGKKLNDKLGSPHGNWYNSVRNYNGT